MRNEVSAEPSVNVAGQFNAAVFLRLHVGTEKGRLKYIFQASGPPKEVADGWGGCIL